MYQSLEFLVGHYIGSFVMRIMVMSDETHAYLNKHLLIICVVWHNLVPRW